MALYPESVLIDEAKLSRLTKTYFDAYKSIYDDLATATDFGIARRKTILAQIEQTLQELGADTEAFIAEQIPFYYESGADDGVAQLKKIYAKVDIKTGFNKIHKEAIAALVDDTAKAFGESISGVARSARSMMNAATKEALTQRLATGQISGDALRQIKKNLKLILKEQGLDALKDKSGRGWTLDRYTEMLIRTKAVEARNTGLKNRLVENGYDLVQVSAHNSDHEECRVWEGKILSLTGATKGYPTVADAEQQGLFHPNCKHAINALTIGLAQETMGWNQNTREYEQGVL